MRFILVTLILLSPLLAHAQTSGNPQLVTVYAYHLKPPYIIDLETETGLYFDFVNYINQKTDKYQFHLIFLPRKRLDIYLQRKQLDGIVVGVNPVWFKDRSQKKYYWTTKIFDDRDEVVSNKGNAFEYTGPESLHGKSIGGVFGYYYFGINEAVASGVIQREDANSERALLEMIHHQRVFAGIVSNSTFNYLVVKHGWQNRFHLSAKPHDQYTRHILIPKQLKAVNETLQPIVKGVLEDKDWQAILSKYRVNF